MSDQLALFDKVRPEPEGLRYAADFVSPAIEQELILGIQTSRFSLFSSVNLKASGGLPRSASATTTTCVN